MSVPYIRNSYNSSFRIPFLTLLFSFAILLTASSDSFLYEFYRHTDGSWFFMAGKAWMNGMTPYVDFTDSKGPLLWLIYGIGYLLSPRSFAGMFWIGVLTYWATFMLVYKTALLLLKEERNALLALFLTAFFYFIPGIHDEMRAEDFEQPFIAAMAFFMVGTFTKGYAGRKTAIGAGICIGATLFIKYNAAAFLCIPALFILIKQYSDHGIAEGNRTLLRMALGFLTVAAPFAVYLIAVGAWNDFISEYFINTFATMQAIAGATGEYPGGNFLHYIKLAAGSFVAPGIIYKLSFIGLLWLPKRLYHGNMLRAAIWSWYIVTVLGIVGVIHTYYLNLLSIFFVFPAVTFCSKLHRVNTWVVPATGAGIILAVATLALAGFYIEEPEIIRDGPGLQKVYERITDEMQRKEAETGKVPRVAYVGLMDRGEHIKAGALPGIKYWAYQNGSTPEMEGHNREDVFSSEPDFVFLRDTDTVYARRLKSAGYSIVMTWRIEKPEPMEGPVYNLYELNKYDDKR